MQQAARGGLALALALWCWAQMHAEQLPLIKTHTQAHCFRLLQKCWGDHGHLMQLVLIWSYNADMPAAATAMDASRLDCQGWVRPDAMQSLGSKQL